MERAALSDLDHHQGAAKLMAELERLQGGGDHEHTVMTVDASAEPIRYYTFFTMNEKLALALTKFSEGGRMALAQVLAELTKDKKDGIAFTLDGKPPFSIVVYSLREDGDNSITFRIYPAR